MLKVDSPYQYLMYTFGRDNAGYAYLGTMGGGKTGNPQCCTAGVLKIALGTGTDLPRVVSFMPFPDGMDIAEGLVDPVNRTLYLGVTVAGAGCKVLKLSLGEGDAPPTILCRNKTLSEMNGLICEQIFHLESDIKPRAAPIVVTVSGE